MPILIQNSGWERKDNLYLRNTQGLSGYASATIVANILDVAGLNGFFRADASTLNMPVAGKTWTVISSGYDTTNTAHILAIADGINNTTMQCAYIGHIVSGAITWASLANAITATKWASARTVTFGDDLTGSFAIDGSGNVTANVAVNDDSHNHVIGNVDNLQSALDLKAPLVSPALTGIPTAPTPATGDSSTKIATTEFVQANRTTITYR